MSIRSMLRNRATIQQATISATTYSSAGTKTWSTRHSNVKCDIQPLSAAEAIRYSSEQSAVSHKMYCMPGEVTGTVASDRVVFNGRYFEITGVRDTDEIGRLLVIELLEITGRTVD